MSYVKKQHYDHMQGEIQCPHCNAMIDEYDKFEVELGVLSWNGSTMEFEASCPHCEKLLEVVINTCFPMSDDNPDIWRGSFTIKKALTATDKKYIEVARSAG